MRAAGHAEVGRVLEFKHVYDITRYGSTATVTRRTVSVDRPHPGRIHRDWVDLMTENGTNLQWPRSTVSSTFRRIS